jgi:hypothetical protein
MCTTTQKSMAKIYYVLILRHDHHIHTLILNNYTKKNQMSYYIIVYIQHVYNSRYCFLIIFIQWWSILSINTKLMLTRKNCFRYLKLMSPLNAAICTTISYTLWVEWYYLKNNYLTSRSKVKVPRRSWWYVTHRLMVMHPHTKYHWPISKDKNVMTQKRKYYLKNNYLTLRSKSNKGHYGTRHTSLWSCTHILNIIDLYGHAPTYQISLTYLERQKSYGPDKLR